MNIQPVQQIKPCVDWNVIETVLLDMDGTLLDKYFDDYFWEHYVPEVYAEQNSMTLMDAGKVLLEKYNSKLGTLEWTDLDYWSEKLGLDIPELKMKVNHLIDVHPFAVDFLKFCRKREKRIYMVTNAHSKTLEIKLKKTAIGPFFDKIICSAEIGTAKEDPEFWPILEKRMGYNPERTMLADDTEAVLVAAREYGEFGALIFVARPSSRIPVKFSPDFPSIVYFKELMA